MGPAVLVLWPLAQMTMIRNLIRIGLGMLAIAVLLASIHRTIRVPMKDGGQVSFVQPSLIGKFFCSNCTITFSPREGKTNSVELAEDEFHGPAMVLASTNTNVFYCIYDHDTDWLLIRIDLSRKFEPLPPKSPLKGGLRRAACKVERVRSYESNDWYFVANALDKMPSKQFKDQSVGLDLLVYRLRNSKGFFAKEIRGEFSTDSRYEDDNRDPVIIDYWSADPAKSP
jgi:hypothetical protein